VLNPDEGRESWFKFYNNGEPIIKGHHSEYGAWQNDDPDAADPSNVSVTIRWQDSHGRTWQRAHPGRAHRS